MSLSAEKASEQVPKPKPIPIVVAGLEVVPVENSTYKEMMDFADNTGGNRTPVYRVHIERILEDDTLREELKDFLKLYNTFIRLADCPAEGKAPWFVYYDYRTNEVRIDNFGPVNDKAKWLAYIITETLTTEEFLRVYGPDE